MNTWIRKVNYKYLNELELAFGSRPFTIAEAYKVYYKHNWEGSELSRSFAPIRTSNGTNQFTDMTARNTLYRAVLQGHLERTRRGEYRFLPKGRVR